jgi:hypothetical protein
MRAQWIVGGLLVAGCIDNAPDDEPHDFHLRLGVIEANDYFGSQMVAGDFNGDGKVDLAIAAVGEGVSGHPGAGAVFIYKGTANGLVPWQVFTENAFASAAINDYDMFGYSLAAREMTGDNAWELVVGAPGYWVNHPDRVVGAPDASVNGISYAGLVDAYAGGGGIPTYVNTLSAGS